MRYAIIGCGRIAANHIKAVYENGFELVAMCDIDPSKFDAMLSRADSLLGSDAASSAYGSVPRYADYEEMLEKHPEIELVAIATESGKHARIAFDCIAAGKHLIIEKPIAMSMADADEIVRRSAEAGVRVAACHQNRFNPPVQALRRAVEAGAFGRMSHGSVHVRWNRGRGYYGQATWRGTWEQDGGCLMNQCIHGIDLLRWMMGDDVVEVYGATAQRFHDYLQAEDVGMAVVRFANGAVGTVEGTGNVYPGNYEESLCLFGETGSAEIAGRAVNEVALWSFEDPEVQALSAGIEAEDGADKGYVYGSGHTPLYADMAEAIRDGRDPYVDAVAGRNAVEMVLAIYKSQKTGLPVKLPLSDFASTDMEGEF